MNDFTQALPLTPYAQRVVAGCARILEEAAIEPFGDAKVYWQMPPEVIEEFSRENPTLPLQMFGYPVHMEVLLGEETVVLSGTVGYAHIVREGVPA